MFIFSSCVSCMEAYQAADGVRAKSLFSDRFVGSGLVNVRKRFLKI